MAKRGNMQATLIAGESLINKAAQPTWDVAFQESFGKGMQAAKAAMAINKAKKDAINNEVAGYINSLNSNVDVSELSGSQQQAITNFLVDNRNEYADAASRIARIDDPSSREYVELRDKMNGIQMAFTNLATQVDSYKEDKISYLKDFESKRISDGNELSTLSESAKMYTDKAELGVGQGGNLVFWNEKNNNYDSYNQMAKPFLKDFGSADQLLQLNEKVYNSGSALVGARKNMVRQKISNMIAQGGRETLLSLASDDFIIEGGLGITDPELFIPGNEDLLKKAVIDSYMNVLVESAAQGARDKRPASTPGSGGFSGALKDEINLSGPVVNSALQFSALSQSVAPEAREQKSRFLVDQINNIDPSRQSPYVTRGEFYNLYLEGNDIEDSEEVRQGFIDQYGNFQIYRLNTRDYSMTRPVAINTDDPYELYQFYLKNTGMSDKAVNYHLGNYKNYIKQMNPTEEPTQTTESGGAYDNL